MIPGGCLTTAMGILPHTDPQAALKLALSVDIPFWPQLPKLSFFEDMYVQASEGFPGILLDEHQARIWLDRDLFYAQLQDYVDHMEDMRCFQLSESYAPLFHEFRKLDLSAYPLVRGQSIGPISFGLNILDGEKKPMIYNDDVREIIFDFISRKVNAQYWQLKEIHPNPLVWVDEPGLEVLFGSYTGYTSERAKAEFAAFLDKLEGPRGVHLCGNPDWSFLLDLKLDVLSIDAYGCGRIFTRYTSQIRDFLESGGIICWGMVPTLTEELESEGADQLCSKIEELWRYLDANGIDLELILSRAWLAPARCCLVNLDAFVSVERSFKMLKEIGLKLRNKIRC